MTLKLTEHLTHKAHSRVRPAHAGGISVAVVGAGGNGCHMVSKLVRLCSTMKALGLSDLHVDIYDPKRVTAANVGRQLFPRCDVGQLKAVVMAHRANLALEMGYWRAIPEKYVGQPRKKQNWGESQYDILITCLDTGAACKVIYDKFQGTHASPAYWLYLGNENNFGQTFLGQFYAEPDSPGRLPTVIDLFGDHFDGTVPETDEPSCSVAEAIKKQRLSMNDAIASSAFTILETLLIDGEIEYAGQWINLKTGVSNPQPVTYIDVPKRKAKPALKKGVR